VPTWHEVKQADTPPIALHLSKSRNFEQFYDLLVSVLKILKKYDRLADRVGADEQAFLDELKIVRVRMEQMCIGVQPTGGIRRPPLKKVSSVGPAICNRPLPPPPPARPKVTKASTLPSPSPPSPPVQHGKTRTDVENPIWIRQSEQVTLSAEKFRCTSLAYV